VAHSGSKQQPCGHPGADAGDYERGRRTLALRRAHPYRVSQGRPRATTAQLHVRIPPDEKAALEAEARRHRIGTSALVRISLVSAREARLRAELVRTIYPEGRQ
jgi:hypothetical protein